MAEATAGLIKEQTYLESLWEAKTNIAIGFVISYMVWIAIVVPLWSIETSYVDNFAITCVFTVTSLARQFFVRRYFNWRQKKHAGT